MPRTIVLLSDGTGNSSAKLFRTNVWRLYEALDLSTGDQIAFYDDGVGSSAFVPLALLGGAFGFGLKRNVLNLYALLCEHYTPGDRIFAFGFSRGAFTIRVLVGLVAHQGIIRQDARPSDLPRLAAWAYRAYRKSYRQTGRLVAGLRLVRDGLFSARDWIMRKPAYASVSRHALPDGGFTFVGVFDTVDAYGVPIDEIADGLDRWVWPLKLPTRTLSNIVGKACHALALDDERQSFHPVLWDEQHEAQDARHLDDERLSQVWFAGMHSNVGGGYPGDALSYVPFTWIVGETQRLGLRFVPDQLARWLPMATPIGHISDSRRGVGAYYRYHPRHLRRLTDGQLRDAPWQAARLVSRIR